MDESGGSGRPRSDGTDGRRPDHADDHSESPRPVDTADSARPAHGGSESAEGPDSTARPQAPEPAPRQAPDETPRPADEPQAPADRLTKTPQATPAPQDTPGKTPAKDTHPEYAHASHGPAPKATPPKGQKGPGGGLLMGRPFGVPVYVAPSWFLVAALITWVFGGQLDRVLPELGAARYLVSLFFAVAFYASVLVHELAHTVAALRFKLPVRRIQLQFFGGVSEIEKESETPGREFILAFVGPLLSLVLAGVFYAGMQAVEPGTVPGVLLAGLMISNLIVAAFNLLPGLPLDGGRMLRAVVWKITGKPMSGTIAAAWVGRALAISVLVGLPILNQSGALGGETQDIGGMDTVTDALLAAILAAIIWTGAGNSLRMARLRQHLPELRARALTRRAVPVETNTPLSEALRRANDAGARALVVVDADGDPMSVVREAAIVGVPEHRRPWVTVSGLAQDITEGMRISAELAGEELLDTLRATPATEYLVVEASGEIYGVLSATDVERAFVKAMARPS
ncbi:site-2 protease family protein [Streptomyces durmitorensis]|uniref:Site-2 protease family protein n=1 Tax=Streptomyces durmitorensis TaxID=319947 RepID=A0ABY4Q366_9ACTN|nr:site-2 protease family protein [Streptomyces durmitorensis]UQT59631.1 site-2 protease family protein [Streptomyces durmitorensis]